MKKITVHPFLFGEDKDNDGYITIDEVDQSKVPTMFPFALPDDSQGITLEKDDIAGITSLYPQPDMEEQFGAIAGVLKNRSGKGLFGVSVLALPYNSSWNFDFAISHFSGYSTGSGGQGEFYITGLPPGSYMLMVEPITENMMGFSCENIGLAYESCDIRLGCEFYSDQGCFSGGIEPDIIEVVRGKTTEGINIVASTKDPVSNIVQTNGAFPILPYIGGNPDGGFPSSKVSKECDSGTCAGGSNEEGINSSECGGCASPEQPKNPSVFQLVLFFFISGGSLSYFLKRLGRE